MAASAYVDAMNIFATLTIIAMLITAVVLIIGLVGFYRGGEFNRKYGNLIMRLRIVSQAVTVLFMLLFLITRGS